MLRRYERPYAMIGGRARASAHADLAIEALVTTTARATRSPFPAPIYKKWFAAFGRRTGARVTYDAVGSGEGILQFTARRIDFGATPGAVGYVELSYAVDRKLEVAAVKNHAGRFVVPSSTTAAMAAQDLAGLSAINDFQVSPAATTVSDAYPISTYTFLVVFQRQFDTAKGTALLRLLRFMTGEGQASATDLHNAPLPPPLRKLITAKLQLLTGPDGTPLV
jgi:ABC-type phosphate transport system substrate-binding protein